MSTSSLQSNEFCNQVLPLTRPLSAPTRNSEFSPVLNPGQAGGQSTGLDCICANNLVVRTQI